MKLQQLLYRHTDYRFIDKYTTHRQTDRQTDRQDRQTERQTIREDLDTEMNSNEALAVALQTYRFIDKCTIDSQINIKTDRQIQTDRQINNKHICRHTDRQTIREDLDTEMNSNEALAVALKINRQIY